MARAVPVVRPDYVRDLCACAAARQPLPPLGTQDAAAAGSAAPPSSPLAAYAPRMDEPSLSGISGLSCAADAARRRLFRGKTFVFSEEAQVGFDCLLSVPSSNLIYPVLVSLFLFHVYRPTSTPAPSDTPAVA